MLGLLTERSGCGSRKVSGEERVVIVTGMDDRLGGSCVVCKVAHILLQGVLTSLGRFSLLLPFLRLCGLDSTGLRYCGGGRSLCHGDIPRGDLHH
jgi:hypothetical protein